MSDISSKSAMQVMQTALVIAFVCALLVSLAAVLLRPYYLENLEAERMARLDSILQVLQYLNDGKQPEFEARMVDLNDGIYSDAVDPASYDARRAANDPAVSVSIPEAVDVAGLKRRARYAVVYLIGKTESAIDGLILPVRGVGYQSALYGYLALSGDSSEILALRFYQQAETPGLGSQIQSPSWESQWPGKQPFDTNGDVNIKFDAISGATRTSIGVERMLQFWLGEFGFGPYLRNLREGRI
ncbi:MAG: NADH:ubiquinone reductase (Na(+)-transporting) subunit C [Gammaproteobacteria bacterium]|nr:NADH:ubiquinone reductase (Na(+)-transporting) subunit C [Gammaproteobacteria bacterium]